MSKSVPKQVCDDGGSYGSQPQVVQSQGGGYGGGSSSAPRGQTGSRAKLRTGGVSSDAVNFGK